MPYNKGLLLSGGVESTCLAWWMRPAIAYTVDYGQVVAGAEINAASAICNYLDIKHIILRARTDFMNTGLLAGNGSDLPTDSNEFWPFRNQFLITCAIMRAYEDDLQEVMIGSVKSDTKFSDGSREFVGMMSAASKFQNGAAVTAPAIDLTTRDLLNISNTPSRLLGLTFSCHVELIPCGQCAGCSKNRSVLVGNY